MAAKRTAETMEVDVEERTPMIARRYVGIYECSECQKRKQSKWHSYWPDDANASTCMWLCRTCWEAWGANDDVANDVVLPTKAGMAGPNTCPQAEHVAVTTAASFVKPPSFVKSFVQDAHDSSSRYFHGCQKSPWETDVSPMDCMCD